MSQLMIVLSGISGVIGITAAAAAFHLGGDNIETVAQFLLFHAPVFLAVGIAQGKRGRALVLAAVVIAIGVGLFCGDLATRHFLAHRLFPLAAPTGASLMIFGWFAVAVIGLRHRS